MRSAPDVDGWLGVITSIGARARRLGIPGTSAGSCRTHCLRTHGHSDRHEARRSTACDPCPEDQSRRSPSARSDSCSRSAPSCRRLRASVCLQARDDIGCKATRGDSGRPLLDAREAGSAAVAVDAKLRLAALDRRARSARRGSRREDPSVRRTRSSSRRGDRDDHRLR